MVPAVIDDARSEVRKYKRRYVKKPKRTNERNKLRVYAIRGSPKNLTGKNAMRDDVKCKSENDMEFS